MEKVSILQNAQMHDMHDSSTNTTMLGTKRPTSKTSAESWQEKSDCTDLTQSTIHHQSEVYASADAIRQSSEMIMPINVPSPSSEMTTRSPTASTSAASTAIRKESPLKVHVLVQNFLSTKLLYIAGHGTIPNWSSFVNTPS